MSDELLPCPFCGETDIEDDWDDYGNMMQRCKGCGANGPVVGNTPSQPIRKEGTLRTAARLLWNQRAAFLLD
jgi:Lar family restriction alleviation protein